MIALDLIFIQILTFLQIPTASKDYAVPTYRIKTYQYILYCLALYIVYDNIAFFTDPLEIDVNEDGFVSEDELKSSGSREMMKHLVDINVETSYKTLKDMIDKNADTFISLGFFFPAIFFRFLPFVTWYTENICVVSYFLLPPSLNR